MVNKMSLSIITNEIEKLDLKDHFACILCCIQAMRSHDINQGFFKTLVVLNWRHWGGFLQKLLAATARFFAVCCRGGEVSQDECLNKEGFVGNQHAIFWVLLRILHGYQLCISNAWSSNIYAGYFGNVFLTNKSSWLVFCIDIIV